MVVASRSLPTPVSPHSSTLASVLAQISTIRLTRSMAAERPTMAPLDVARPRRAPAAATRPCRLPLPLDPRQQRKDVLVAERLGEKIERPELDRLDGHGNAAVGGHHDDFHVGQRALLDPLQQLDAVELGHFQVGHDHVEPPGGQLVQRFLPVGGGDHLMPLRGQIVGQGDPFDLFVVDDKDVALASSTGAI